MLGYVQVAGLGNCRPEQRAPMPILAYQATSKPAPSLKTGTLPPRTPQEALPLQKGVGTRVANPSQLKFQPLQDFIGATLFLSNDVTDRSFFFIFVRLLLFSMGYFSLLLNAANTQQMAPPVQRARGRHLTVCSVLDSTMSCS